MTLQGALVGCLSLLAVVSSLGSLCSLLGAILVLGDLDGLLALVVGVTGYVLDESVDEGVLVQGLGADHHVGLGVAILTRHRVGHLEEDKINIVANKNVLSITFC